MLLVALLSALQTPSAAPTPAPALTATVDAPLARGWNDFPVFVWREKYKGKPLPAELADPFGGVILMRDEDSSWARARWLSYLIWNVAGRDALHLDADAAWNARVEQWIQTHDEKLLVRTPCLNDPATLAQLFATLDATLARHADHPGLGFVLGDEVGLTPNGDPFDLCRCAFCEAKWKEYAQKNGLPERAPLTDEVRQKLLEGDYSLLGAWLARRRFDQEQVVRLLQELIAKRNLDQNTFYGGPYVGLLGCTGQTAFGGVALERIIGRLGLIECYPVGDARELVATFPGLWRHALDFSSGPDRRPHPITTLFVKEESAAGLAWQVFDTWIRGGVGMVLWSDAELEGLPSAARARLDEAIATVRGLEWSFLGNDKPTRLRMTTYPQTVAIVHDADSTAVSFLRDALQDGSSWPRRKAGYQQVHGQRERKVETWLRLFEDCGFEPGSVPLESVCAGCAADFEVLVLPEVLVLDEADIRRLETYLDAGGTLVFDGTCGWVNRRGVPDEPGDVRKRLALHHSERVLDAPSSIAGYLETRSDFARGADARRFVLELPAIRRMRSLLEQGGVPSFTGEDAELPWYIACITRTRDETGLALLPNYTTPEQRREHLRDLPLTGIHAPDGFAIQWIHPPGGGVLRAGDAALLRIERQQAAK